MELFDTHAHIHFSDYGLDPDAVWAESVAAGVTRMLAVGCDVASSQRAIDFAARHDNVWAVVGVHPHEARTFFSDGSGEERLRALLDDAAAHKIVAIGEFGLDYYYDHSPKADQLQLLRLHLELAQHYRLPVVLHIRDAFDDLWPVFDEYNTGNDIRGVVHCFTGTSAQLSDALKRNLYVALNGIMTFTKDDGQLAAAKAVPLNRLLIETDAPYLTPKPFRGKICKPEHIVHTAQFLAELRGETVGQIARATTANAQRLFQVS